MIETKFPQFHLLFLITSRLLGKLGREGIFIINSPAERTFQHSSRSVFACASKREKRISRASSEKRNDRAKRET